jgi:hypothetical protein
MDYEVINELILGEFLILKIVPALKEPFVVKLKVL